MKWSKILFISSIFFYSAGYAQEKDIVLDPVSITATISPQKISKTGRNVFVIKGEAFNNLPVHSIDELLKYLPGIEVQMRGPMGSQADIVIRGGTFQQVLIIVDGVRLNDPNSGHFSGYIPIAPSEIDRIEILKGASSAIYGSEAVGGVIQVFTKSFAAKRSQKITQLSSVVTAGQYGLLNVNAGGNFSKDESYVSAGLLTNNADGQQQRGTTGYFHNTTASVSATHFFNEYLQVSFRSAYDKRRFSAQNFYTTFVSDTANEEVETFWDQLRIVYAKKKNKFSFDAGYKSVGDQYAFNAAIVPNNNRSKLLQATATYQHQFNGETSLITGAQFMDKVIRSNDRGDHTADQAAAFVLLNQNFHNFFVSPAVRIDHDSRGGTEFVPQINLSYKIEKFQLRGSAGKTIRQADFTERYNNYNKAFVASGSIGNPELQAERSFSYEAGSDYFMKNIKLSATVFRREQKNVIDWVPTPYASMPRKSNLSATGTYALASNIAKVNTTGIETDIQYSRDVNEHNIIGTVGFLYLNDKTSGTAPSFYISSHAKYLVNFNLEYRIRIGSVSISGIYKNRNPQAASAIFATTSREYFLFNAKAEGYFFKQRLSAFAEADNVFDKSYSDLLGARMPGRWIMGGLRWQLNETR